MKQTLTLGFDADDTLWSNETYFRAAEASFFELMKPWISDPKEAESRLYEVELRNLSRYGYGIKGFTLSIIEAALDFSQGSVNAQTVQACLKLGQSMLEAPVILLDGVKETLEKLYRRYPLIIVTKGDLFDQTRKLRASGLEHYFHHVEVVSHKHTADYARLLAKLDLKPGQFIMTGNSFLSDVLPVVQLGAQAVHIPFETTWSHETGSSEQIEKTPFHALSSIRELPALLERKTETSAL